MVHFVEDEGLIIVSGVTLHNLMNCNKKKKKHYYSMFSKEKKKYGAVSETDKRIIRTRLS